ncbi:putative non-specific serine/threonine protein kinase [Dioscorea sansibarensis]
MEEFILGLIASNGDIEKKGLSSLMHICSFFGNCIYGSLLTSIKGDNNLFIGKVSQYIIKLLDHMTSILEEKYNEIHCNSCLGLSSILDAVGLSLLPLQGFLSSPLFPHCRGQDYKLLGGILQTIEKLSLSLAKLFSDLFSIDITDLSPCTLPSPENCYSVGEPSGQIIDMELDVTDVSKDADALDVRSSDT